MAERYSTYLVKALEAHLDSRQPVSVPEGGKIIWDTFVALSRTRTRSDAQPNAISYQEIEAYCRLMRIPLEPHHVRVIIDLDSAWISWALKPPKPLPELSAAAFDARIGI